MTMIAKFLSALLIPTRLPKSRVSWTAGNRW
jgi:hypothetical protein